MRSKPVNGKYPYNGIPSDGDGKGKTLNLHKYNINWRQSSQYRHSIAPITKEEQL